MKKQRGFTLIELLVVIAIIALLWILYTEDNDGRIVNGAPVGGASWIGDAYIETSNTNDDHYMEKPWVGRAWADGYETGNRTTPDQQKSAIKAGAMWPYTEDIKLYRCPTGLAGEHITYAAMDAANGLRRGAIQDVHWMKNITAYRRPHYRIVFIDEGWVTPDSFAITYGGGDAETWWDDPPVRHGEGTAQSYADGHSDWQKWRGAWTVAYGLATIGIHPQNFYQPGDTYSGGPDMPPGTPEDYHDLYWIQKGNWGELVYNPSY
jgi:prepilin-type N-terminal cleavage/methylation domain-containing protein